MNKLQKLHTEQGQSPWLDNLTRGHLIGGELRRLVAAGIRGVTSNPTIFAKAISGSADYDHEFRTLVGAGTSVTDAYWQMVVADIEEALAQLRPVYDESGGDDGFVSVELAPGLASDTTASVTAARRLHERIYQPNLLVKIPATPQGVPAVEAMIAEGRSINITLLFSLDRYEEVIEAYLAGLEMCSGDLGRVHSVASFFVSRVDTEVDRRLEAIGTDEALALRGRAAVAQAKVAYQLFRDRFSGPRWAALAGRGARVQRPLWASTSTKNPTYADTVYVDSLIGRHTINTLPETTIAAFEDHGTVAATIEREVDVASSTLDRLESIGVSMTDVGRHLEDEGVAAFTKSFGDLLATLDAKRTDLAAARSEAR
jgi:transaldolase